MDASYSKNRKFKRIFVSILSIFVIAAMAFPVAEGASAQTPGPRIVASIAGDWLWTTDFSPGTLDILIYESADEGATLLWKGSTTADDWGFAFVGYDVHGQDLVTGNYLVVADEMTEKRIVLETITMEVFDTENEIMAGTAPAGREVTAVAGMAEAETQAVMNLVADPQSGAWLADFKTIPFDITEEMRPWSFAQIFDEDGDANEAGTPPPLPSTWRDDFDTDALAPGWFWENGDSGEWSLGEEPGFLRLNVSNSSALDGNLLLRQVQQGDFAIETHVTFEPNTNFQFAGLVLYQDESNDLALGRAFCDIEGACVGNGIYFDYVAGGNWINGNFGTVVDSPSEVFLRLERRGDMVRAFYSNEGGSWYEIGTHWISPDFQVNGVGLMAGGDSDTSDPNVSAYFDYFELTEGWGFLPEGFHDGEQGDVPSWACNTNGWAADPDNREADVNIEIVVDHQTATSLEAGEFRQDLLDAGVCVDGNCSFSTSLWGLISSYQPHRVDAWAQDDTGKWVLLSNSAKTLTCRTYDIFTFDPTAGATVQITNLPDMHEFNPRWSPDAKKIVHDAWNTDWSSHGIYITDVKTGASTPLSGAEGGSYPTWSPNGKWIAFDRGADNDYRLFIVPPTGGVPKLVRDDAFIATWAPNSQRLAFHQPSDGSIRTMNLNGQNVTLVAERGNGPAWSPDGEWIAFEMDGDVWKVRVNNNGAPLGNPIRLTSSPAWEGRPTWSYNSKTIAFHAGMGQDTDIWTIPAAGGAATWLTGAPSFGDYDPNYSLKGQSTYISYASFSPQGQAARLWVAAYTYDLPSGYWSEGRTHTYHYEAEWSDGSEITPELSFNVSRGVQPYDGYALLRPYAVRIGADCRAVGTIHPDQRTRFLSGYVTDYDVDYAGALAYFDSLTARAAWDDGQSAELARHDIIPFNEGDWFNYVCTFTEAPPKMDLRVNYGHDWVESFYEAGHAVSIQVTDSEGNVKATAEAFTGPREEWGGATGFQTTPESWSPAPPDLQPYDWVYAQVDNGATAQVQLGDIQGEVNFQTDNVTGTIMADWLSEPVPVECLDWGSGQQPPFDNKDGGFHLTNGSDPYSCSWEGEWDVQPWQDIGVGYITPDRHWVANAFRDDRWMAFWTYTPDPPTGLFEEGEHSYYYEWAYTAPVSDSGTSGPRTITIASAVTEVPTPIYGGFALIGPWGWDYPGKFRPQVAWTGSACEGVSVLHPDQPMRFVWGWVNDYSMTYEEALAHFGSLTIEVFWDDFSNGSTDGSAPLVMLTDLVPYTGQDARFEYLCPLTE